MALIGGSSERHRRDRSRTSALPEVHGLGRHRSAVDDVERDPEGFTARAIARLDDVERYQRAAVRADQRQPHRLRQAREHRCHGTLRAAIAKIKAEPEPPAFVLHTGDLTHLSQAVGVRHAAAGAVGTVAPGFLRAGRARRPRGRRGDLSAAIRQGHARRRLAELRPRRRALHRTRQRRQPEGWRARLARDRAARVARERRQAAQEQHAHRRLCAHPAVDRLSGLGMGHRRQRAGAVVPEAVRVGLRPQRPHPSGDAEGRRTRDVPHGHVDRIPSTGARHCTVARTDEGGRRSAAQGAGALAHVVSAP